MTSRRALAPALVAGPSPGPIPSPSLSSDLEPSTSPSPSPDLEPLRGEQAQGVLGKLAKMRKESIVMFEP